jgi:glycosyltransferase involved in cell wall biosynthesis
MADARTRRRLKVFQVEPSMFTPPYAEGLDAGLTAAGVDVTWITRPERPGETMGVPQAHLAPIFYRGIDGNDRIPRRLRGPLKGVSHVFGLLAFATKAFRERPDIIHYQWTVIPVLDVPVLRLLKRFVAPVVFTAHNSIPYHGDRISTLQNLGADWALAAASHILVHTESSRRILIGRGVARNRITIVPHGPHYLGVAVPAAPKRGPDDRYTIVLFGNIKPYKGLDLLIEAVSTLSPQTRDKLSIIVAGQAHMDTRPLVDAIAKLGLTSCFELRLQRQSEAEMAALFGLADAFVFPYRFIDASGVYYYVKPLRKWVIASNIGVFAEDMVDQSTGALVAPGDSAALAAAIEDAVRTRPTVSSTTPMVDWPEIGAMTKAAYLKLLPGDTDDYV